MIFIIIAAGIALSSVPPFTGNYITNPIKQTRLSSNLNPEYGTLDPKIFSSPRTEFSRIKSKESNPETTIDRRRKSQIIISCISSFMDYLKPEK